jgi:hypothetical protein
MFYEKNGSTINNHSQQLSTPTNSSSRRSSYQQPTSVPSTTKTFNGLMTRQVQQVSSRPNLASSYTKQAERMQRSKSYKDLFDSPSIAHPVYQQQSPTNPSTPYYSSSYYSNHLPTPTIVGSMLGNASSNEYQRRQQSSSNHNFIPDDMSSSSTGHLPKPPPGIPSQNAR